MCLRPLSLSSAAVSGAQSGWESNHVVFVETLAMSYLDKELFKVPGPTNYFRLGHPLTTFTEENPDLDQSVKQGKASPAWT